MNQTDIHTIQYIIDEIDLGMHILNQDNPDEDLKEEIKLRALSLTEINIGESVKKLSSEIKAANDSIPWKEIAGARDVAAHKYSILSENRIIDTVRFDFPELRNNLVDILNKATKE